MTKLAEQLSALLAYRNTPDHPPEPITSNWTTTPANDNADPTETADYSFERKLHVTPSVQEIMRHVATGPIVRAAPQNGASQGPIVQIGKLHFSDGESRERAFVTGPDGAIVQGERKMPLGAMLRTREKSEAPAGGKGYNDVDLLNSDKFYASTFGTAMPRFIKRGDRRNGPSLTPEQSRALIDEAMANTAVLPPVTYYPPGLPCGSDRVADSFLAFRKVPTGKSGSVAWQDIGQTIENAKVWKNLRKALKTKDMAVLDAAMRAQSYTDILPGGSARGARKRGKRALLAANDNLAEYLKMFAA